MICQLNMGIGGGDRSLYLGAMEKVFERQREIQKTCQKELANCILKKDKLADSFKTSTALKCITER